MEYRTGTILVDKYELLEEAGRGGMAEVWRARTHGAAGFQRQIAIKRLLPKLARDREFIAMLVEEARVVAELQHPGIVQIHDFNMDADGDYFLVIEWVEGVDLGRFVIGHRIGGNHPPWVLVTAIGVEMLGALSAAHGHIDTGGLPAPIYHRDVTPTNILISLDGYVKLTDFGVARAMDRSTVTRPNAIKGKISYTAPEILSGAKASVETDLYAAGVVLWEVLAGRRLFRGASASDVITQVKSKRVPRLTELRDDVPEALSEVVMRSISRDPRKRYRSAAEMALALAFVLRDAEEPSSPQRIARRVALVRNALDLAGPLDEHLMKTQCIDFPGAVTSLFFREQKPSSFPWVASATVEDTAPERPGAIADRRDRWDEWSTSAPTLKKG